MKRFGYVIAALGAMVIAAPSIASAETVVIKRGGYHDGYHHGHGARAEMRRTVAGIAEGTVVTATRW